MRDKLESNLQTISDQIDANCSGIIWVTTEKLDSDLPQVYEFNYLLNGLLGKSIAFSKEHQIENTNHFFLSDSYGHPFFVAHLSSLNQNDTKKIHEQLDIVKHLREEISTVLIHSPENLLDLKKVIKDLNKNYQNHYQFKQLEI